MPSTNRKKKIFISITLISVFAIIFPVFAYAGDTGTINIIEAYKKAGILKNTGIISYCLRELGWLIAKGLYYLVIGLESVVLSINNVLGGFYKSEEFTTFLNKFKPFMIGLLAISICALGFKFMFNPKMDKTKVATNILLSVLVIVGLPLGMNELSKISNTAIEAIKADDLCIANQILYENVTDVLIYDSMGMPVPIPKPSKTINIDKDSIVNINPTAKVNYKKARMDDVFKYTVEPDENGIPQLEKNKKEMFGIDFTGSMYYRYKIDFFSIYVTLIISSLALVLSGIKIARLLYELAINQSIAFFTAVMDIGGGQRLKKCIEKILGTFIILFSCFFFLQVYLIGSAYCNDYFDNIFARLIALGALAWAVIDGPNLVEQIVGIDAGINSALKTISATYMATKTIGAIGKGVGNLNKKVADKASKVGAGVVGGVAGGVSGVKSNLQYSSNSNSESATVNKSENNSEKNSVSTSVSNKSGDSPISNNNTSSNTSSKTSSSSNSQLHTSNNNANRTSANTVSTQANNTKSTNSNLNNNQNTKDTNTSSSNNNSDNNQNSNKNNDNNIYKNQTLGGAFKQKVNNSNFATQYRRSYELTSNSIQQPYQKKVETIKQTTINSGGGLYATTHKTKKANKIYEKEKNKEK